MHQSCTFTVILRCQGYRLWKHRDLFMGKLGGQLHRRISMRTYLKSKRYHVIPFNSLIVNNWFDILWISKNIFPYLSSSYSMRFIYFQMVKYLLCDWKTSSRPISTNELQSFPLLPLSFPPSLLFTPELNVLVMNVPLCHELTRAPVEGCVFLIIIK